VPVSVFGAPPDPRALAAYRRLGVLRCVLRLEKDEKPFDELEALRSIVDAAEAS
jgi:hypothetical protein